MLGQDKPVSLQRLVLPRLPGSCAAMRNFTSGKSHVYAPLERAVVLKWFYSLSRRKTFVGGKCALPSAF